MGYGKTKNSETLAYPFRHLIQLRPLSYGGAKSALESLLFVRHFHRYQGFLILQQFLKSTIVRYPG